MLPYLLKRAGPYPEFTTKNKIAHRMSESRSRAYWLSGGARASRDEVESRGRGFEPLVGRV